ncbi:thrombospondin [Alkalitalea saponilacus]|uniref:Gliding motility-associated C-terminal domain-containing protein n=2 Tax=Alkalitalea saponilacus TaxID=889453 RepID=A0A1T5EWE8_9BACT|nr:thrombospondin [Alkalitalea saponilacus]SKB88211.1 gliding motility-associated C-terminal domain-containing protein [Alkalitalea saponilacus]
MTIFTLISNKKRITILLLFLCMILPLSGSVNHKESLNDISTFMIEEQSGIRVIANNDAIVTNKMHPHEANVIINDYGLSAGITSMTILEPPINGTAIVTERNTIIYTPNRYFTGHDYFEYRVCNTYGNCDGASVFVTVEDYDFKPVAVNDTVTVFKDSNSSIDVLQNDKNLYDLPISLSIVSNFRNARAEVSNNQISFRVDQYFLGMDSLFYEVCDRDGDCSRAYLFIKLADDSDNKIFIPQGFSPDGDNINDTFNIPEFDQYSNLSITIFNRHGVMVYDDQQYNNNWNGMANTGPFNGKLLPTGVYYYAIKIPGLKKQITGYVYLSR